MNTGMQTLPTPSKAAGTRFGTQRALVR